MGDSSKINNIYLSPDHNICTPNQGWGQVQLTKYSSTPSTPNIYQVQVLIFLKST